MNEVMVDYERGCYYGYMGMASDSDNIGFKGDPDVNSQTLKIDIEMAIAMTKGYEKNGNIIRTCILSSHPKSKALEKEFEKYPKLITHSKISNTKGSMPVSGHYKRPLSLDGIKIKENVLKKSNYGNINYPFHFKYIAVLIAKYHIVNKLEVWKDICETDIFGIWEPVSPFKNIEAKEDPLILLLRVYELQSEYPRDNIDFDYHDFYANLEGDTILTVKEPVINDKNFYKIQLRLDDILMKHGALRKKEIFINKENKKDNTVRIKTIKTEPKS